MLFGRALFLDDSSYATLTLKKVNIEYGPHVLWQFRHSLLVYCSRLVAIFNFDGYHDVL